jgi:two-component system, chemotaxis family, chemotaxis protein CheY
MAKNVLIVDDSATMRQILIRGIRQAGIDIARFQEAADGAEGLRAAANGSFDLIVSDVNMPNLNGLDFVTAVGRQLADPPPIVMIAPDDGAGVVDDAMTRGASGCLKRPFTPEQIRQILGPFLE